jgi:hypothetical protein
MECAFGLLRGNTHLPPIRWLSAAVTGLSLIAGGFLVLVFTALGARAENAFGNCEDDVAVLPAPLAPWKGAPLRVLVVAEKPLDGELSLVAPSGRVAVKSHDRQGGPPYFWYVEVTAPAAGTWHATLTRDHGHGGCRTHDIIVSAKKPAAPHVSDDSLWPIRYSWNRSTENLYSAWIAKLFDAQPNVELSWKAWYDVLRDRSRNFLFNYLGLNEDSLALSLHPDCADFVYFMRAYFAYKLGLPFGYSNCSRGTGGVPPKCYQWFDILDPELTRPPPPPEQTASALTELPQSRVVSTIPPALKKPSFGEYLRAVGDVVHTGSVRVSSNDDDTDFYTTALTPEALRPGTVFADPYGHVLMLVKRVPESNGAPGVFLAVDAEPDGSVTRKRFWRGNFLFVHDAALGSPGFKHFRPIVRETYGDMRRLTNTEIAKDPQYGDFSLEQSQLGAEDFYDRMDDIMSPEPLNPVRAMEDAITSLEEQVKTRAVSVENGRQYQDKEHGIVEMPNGPSIFETTGAWEDYATPGRDFRLLIAIDVVRGFPDRVARRPDRYAMPEGKSSAEVKAELRDVLASVLSSRKFSYTRSDGSHWTLSLKDVIDRAADLEMGYNPNDCVELRWGAPEKSAEASTCKLQAPSEQRANMTEYRNWFRERRWPSHV